MAVKHQFDFPYLVRIAGGNDASICQFSNPVRERPDTAAHTAAPNNERADLRPESIQDAVIRLAGCHGDSPRVVLAAASVEGCFYIAIEASRIARKYSTPVFVSRCTERYAGERMVQEYVAKAYFL